MKISLSEAAKILGRTERQVRYGIQKGQLAATKVAGRWRIDTEALPLSVDERRGLAERLAMAKAAFDKGLAPARKVAGEKKVYSLTRLEAFSQGAEVLQAMRGALGQTDPACEYVRSALEWVSRGFHSYHPRDKAARFTEAREEAASAVADLLLRDSAEGAKELALRVEAEVIPKIAGLVAAYEKRSKKKRFDRFGSHAPDGR